VAEVGLRLLGCAPSVGTASAAGRCGSGRRGRRVGARLAIDQEADLRDARQVGVERAADGKHGQRFGFKAGGMARGEGAGEVDDGEFWAGSEALVRSCLVRPRRQPEFDSRGAQASGRPGRRKAAPPGIGMGGVGSGIEVEQLAKDGAGAGAGVLREGQGLDLGEQGTVRIVGDQQSSLLRREQLRAPGGR
jgi:hypothetical protein